MSEFFATQVTFELSRAYDLLAITVIGFKQLKGNIFTDTILNYFILFKENLRKLEAHKKIEG